MPRHAQPLEVAKAKGATRRNPQRYRKEIPESRHSLGDAPEHLSEPAAKMWFEFAEYAPVGAWTGADRQTLEILCEMYAEFREDPRKFPTNRLGPMLRCMGMLGLSPADRQKLGVEKPKGGNPFDAF